LGAEDSLDIFRGGGTGSSTAGTESNSSTGKLGSDTGAGGAGSVELD
jgi:hypothetical protein